MATTCGSTGIAGAALTKDGKDLVDVMRQRREGCTEFESRPDASIRGAGAADGVEPARPTEETGSDSHRRSVAGVQCEVSNLIKQATDDAGGAVTRAGKDLKEVMRQRRETCKEFESCPDGSTADATAVVNAPSGAASATGGRGGEQGSGADECRRTRKSDDELSSLMEQRRSQCHVLESQQAVPADMAPASASSASPPETRPKRLSEAFGGYAAAGAVSANVAPNQVSNRGRTSDVELKGWMERMRARCQVMESTPEAAVADAVWSDASLGGQDADAGDEIFPAPSSIAIAQRHAAPQQFAGAAHRQAVGSGQTAKVGLEGSGQRCSTADTPPPDPSHDACTGLRLASPLSPEERYAAWTEALQLSLDAAHEEPSNEAPHTSRALLQLLESDGALAGARPDDGALRKLATSFTRIYASWECAEPAASAKRWPQGSLFCMLAQLLRYHFPEVAVAIEDLCGDTLGSLSRVLATVMDSQHGMLFELLLTPGETHESKGSLHLCDLVVLERKPLLPICIAVALLAKASPTDGETCDGLVSRIRGDVLADVRRHAFDDVAALVRGALDLLQTTPTSLGPELVSEASPLCQVSAEEVLSHVFGRPQSLWRLVVIDVRRSDFDLALPIGIRMSTSQDRKAVGESLPYEECIHLCLMADKPPATGEEALELGRHITGKPACRKHVSVVAGGWPAVREAALSLGHELTQVEIESDGNLLIKRVGLKKVAEEVKKAHAVAVKRAQKAFSGASSLFQRFSEQCDNALDKMAGKGVYKPPKERELEFGEGSLGFDVAGTRVIRIDEHGQAASQGLRMGDALVAIAGRRIPPPPTEDSTPETEQRVKRLITKWIKERERPVKLTFSCPQDGA